MSQVVDILKQGFHNSTKFWNLEPGNKSLKIVRLRSTWEKPNQEGCSTVVRQEYFVKKSQKEKFYSSAVILIPSEQNIPKHHNKFFSVNKFKGILILTTLVRKSSRRKTLAKMIKVRNRKKEEKLERLTQKPWAFFFSSVKSDILLMSDNSGVLSLTSFTHWPSNLWSSHLSS